MRAKTKKMCEVFVKSLLASPLSPGQKKYVLTKVFNVRENTVENKASLQTILDQFSLVRVCETEAEIYVPADLM
jgi:hypothetical protein